MNNINVRVLLKEPRGFIRLLQILFAIFAWSTTHSFSTVAILHIYCPDEAPWTVEYRIKYPFDLRESEISYPSNCANDVNVVNEKFPIDFSATAMLYVLLCVISLLYAIASLVYYCVFTSKYETDPLAPMIDLGITLLLTFSWILITCTWALNVADLKHYAHPGYFEKFLDVCHEELAGCKTADPGKYSSLTVSIICGFTCIALWLGSNWFIFKETSLHKKQPYQNSAQNSMSPQQPM